MSSKKSQTPNIRARDSARQRRFQVMGCCSSSVSPSPYPAQNHQNGNSASPINSSQPASQNMIPRPSTNASNQSGLQPHRQPDLTKLPTKDLKPHVWKSQERTWTRAQIDAERIAFFDTRVTGRQEIWQAIRTALEVLWAGGEPEEDGDRLATAQVILKAAGVTIPSGNLTRDVYDGLGARYDLPDYVVSDPTNLVELSTKSVRDDGNKSEDGGAREDEDELWRKEEIRRGKAVVKSEDMTDIRVKLSDRETPPLVVSVNKQDLVRIITQTINDEAELESPKHIRLAYMGKMLLGNQTLQAQGWQEGHVINGYVLG
ncbi:uncharacterized protein RCO7_01338 [Rhynchosporium graminicola]|uniref:Ubiquitin-like domain-containing protein n=1 Tax=Rhynchosporium graminicola TaxID=2792576 RepID=A0A1E1JYJ4_9HELO|nr:uncharacterized protein RCO7_01338 [Rhynchosporium commune]